MDKRKEIEKVAYELYEKAGYAQGQDLDHWLEAERIIHSRYVTPDTGRVKVSSAAKTASRNIVGTKGKKPASGSKTARTSPAKKRT